MYFSQIVMWFYSVFYYCISWTDRLLTTLGMRDAVVSMIVMVLTVALIVAPIRGGKVFDGGPYETIYFPIHRRRRPYEYVNHHMLPPGSDQKLLE